MGQWEREPSAASYRACLLLMIASIATGLPATCGRIVASRQVRSLRASRAYCLPPVATPVADATPAPFRFGHGEELLFVGSCFSEHISGALCRLGFAVTANPTGILFNPRSISNCLTDLRSARRLADADVSRDARALRRGGDEVAEADAEVAYFSFRHSTRYTAGTRGELLARANGDMEHAASKLAATKIIFVTFGTAKAYFRVDTGEVVANCHRQSPSMFRHKLLSVDEIVQDFSATVERLLRANPNVKFVFTVSPVRHTREGIVTNTLSKSTLVCASHALCASFPRSCFYFPSYEYLMDELRDYRWYAEDLIHPSEAAQKVVLHHFLQKYATEEARELCRRIEKINRNLRHRPQRAGAPSFARHLKNTARDMDAVRRIDPSVRWDWQEEQLRELEALSAKDTPLMK